jgi:H+-transporting ATPase
MDDARCLDPAGQPTQVGAYWVIRRYNLFGVNTATLVNMRDKTTFGDKDSLARMSAGMVEGKLLEKQVGMAHHESFFAC